jgi:hypothetical protein
MLQFEVNQILFHMAVRPLLSIAQEGTFMASKEGVKLITRWPEDFFDYDFFGVLSLRSRDFHYFLCESERFIGVNFDYLLEMLALMAQDPLYELEGDKLIGFCAQDNEQRGEISLINISTYLSLNFFLNSLSWHLITNEIMSLVKTMHLENISWNFFCQLLYIL